MSKAVLIVLILFIAITSIGAKFVQPPPDKDLPASVQNYLRSLYDNATKLERVTTNPDGDRTGEIGEMLLLETGGNYYLEINVTGSNVWRGILLSDTP